MKSILISTFILLTNVLFGQYLEFSKGKKKLIISQHAARTFKLKNGTTFKGTVDTLTENSITIKSDKIGQVVININEIKKIKRCDYIYKLGPSFRIGYYCVSTNLENYKCKLKYYKKIK